jgi:hypothetical protein
MTIQLNMKQDLAWGLGRLNLESKGSTENVHLRFSIHPAIIETEGITLVRDFYKYVNEYFFAGGSRANDHVHQLLLSFRERMAQTATH